MLYSRDDRAPAVHPTARVAPSAQIIGDVVIGPECFVDHQAVIASSGPPVVLLLAAAARAAGHVAHPSPARRRRPDWLA